MKTAISICLFLLVLCGLAAAQTPQYTLSAGLGFNHYEVPQFKGELSFGTRVADGTYAISTLNTTSKVSTITTGVAHQFFTGQGFTLSGLVDGGLSTGNGAVGGVVSGGGILSWDASKAFKVSGAFIYGAVKVVEAPIAGSVSPTFSFGFGKTF